MAVVKDSTEALIKYSLQQVQAWYQRKSTTPDEIQGVGCDNPAHGTSQPSSCCNVQEHLYQVWTEKTQTDMQMIED